MEAMVQEWTDGRLDELSHKVDRGFEQVDRRSGKLEIEIRTLRAEMKDEFKSVRREIGDLRLEMKDEFKAVRAEIGGLRGDINDRLFALQRTMVQIVLGLAASMAVGFVGIFTLLLTLH